MAHNAFSTYSLKDTQTVIEHPNVGRCVISEAGGGKLVIARSGDISSHTTTATGYVVVNKTTSRNGQVQLELPQNSDADIFMRRWINYLETSAVKFFGLTTLTVTDTAADRTYSMTGVTPQKRPDISYDQASGTVNYTLLVADIDEN